MTSLHTIIFFDFTRDSYARSTSGALNISLDSPYIQYRSLYCTEHRYAQYADLDAQQPQTGTQLTHLVWFVSPDGVCGRQGTVPGQAACHREIRTRDQNQMETGGAVNREMTVLVAFLALSLTCCAIFPTSTSLLAAPGPPLSSKRGETPTVPTADEKWPKWAKWQGPTGNS